MNWGKRIKEERTKQGINKSELAKMCGLTYATINNVEKGMPVTATTLEKICKALGLKINIK